MRHVSLILISLILLEGCDTTTEPSGNGPFVIDRYDLDFEIDADQNIFNSHQVITLTAQNKTGSMEFTLHHDLVIDSIGLNHAEGGQLEVTSWAVIGEESSERLWGTEVFSRVEVLCAKDIRGGQTVNLTVDYHMEPGEIHTEPGAELLVLTISQQGSRAIGPVTGIVPVFGGNIHAPFRMQITYPQGNLACVPGDRIATSTEGGQVTETYESDIPMIPVFSVTTAEKVVRSQDGITVEYYLADGQSFPEEVIDNTFAVFQLFNNTFGEPGVSSYRFAFVDVDGSTIGGENKGNAIYFTHELVEDYVWSEQERRNFTATLSHEIFHNWNIWYVDWQGNYYNWFVEGGANFIAAWAMEQIDGQAAGRATRFDYVKDFIAGKGYQASATLENVQKRGNVEVSLMYFYGALVWEQLRQYLGNEALFSGLGDFFQQYSLQKVSLGQLIDGLEDYTQANVKAYLDQWTKHNARIDLSAGSATIQPNGALYETTMEWTFYAERDYEIHTTLGYLTEGAEDITMVAVHATKRGTHTATFSSAERPIFIQIDPDYRVPQLDVSNDIWQE